MPVSSQMLTDLLSPIDCETFFREHWERQPLLVSRDDPQRYAGVLALCDVDQIIAYTRPRFQDKTAFEGRSSEPSSFVRGVLDGQSKAAEFEPGLADLRAAYEQGKSVVIMSMHRRWPAVAELCRKLEMVFRCPVHANMYLTPAGSQGFAAHYDPHEVLILQLEGSKRWRLYDRTELLPLASDKAGIAKHPLGAAREMCLQPGDLLYIPRGHVHDAYTADSYSLHLTIGINVYRWADLIQHAVTCASRSEPKFRQSISGGCPDGTYSEGEAGLRRTFQQLLSMLADANHADDLFDKAARALADQFYGQLPMLPGSQFSTQVDLNQVGLDTVLENKSLMLCRVLESDESVSIEFPGNRVAGPRRIASALRFIAGTERFAVQDLPGDLNGQAKVVLVRRLIREGLLRPTGRSPSRSPESTAPGSLERAHVPEEIAVSQLAESQMSMSARHVHQAGRCRELT